MPTYDFRCKRCGFQFEARCSIESRDEERLCELCGHKAERFWGGSAPGITFKGSGWTEKGLAASPKKVELD